MRVGLLHDCIHMQYAYRLLCVTLLVTCNRRYVDDVSAADKRYVQYSGATRGRGRESKGKEGEFI